MAHSTGLSASSQASQPELLRNWIFLFDDDKQRADSDNPKREALIGTGDTHQNHSWALYQTMILKANCRRR
jgi:hypothetical protein